MRSGKTAGAPPGRAEMVRRVAVDRLSAAERAALLARDVSATLAFVDGEGFPRIVPCWFLWHEGAFYTTSFADKFHVRCLRRNARAAFCVETEELEPGRWRANRQVKGVGTAEIFPDPDGLWVSRVRARYLRSARLPDAAGGAARVVVRIAPRRLTAHGSRLELV